MPDPLITTFNAPLAQNGETLFNNAAANDVQIRRIYGQFSLDVDAGSVTITVSNNPAAASNPAAVNWKPVANNVIVANTEPGSLCFAAAFIRFEAAAGTIAHLALAGAPGVSA